MTAQCNVIFQINPPQAVTLSWRGFNVAEHCIRISQPRQIDARAHRQPNPFPHARVDVEQLVFAASIVVDELDFAYAVMTELLEDIDATLDYLFDVAGIDKTGGAEIRWILFELAPNERALRLPVASDVAAKRIKAVDARAYDFLRQQRMMTRALAQCEKRFAIVGAENFLAEFVGELALERWLHDARVADLIRYLLGSLFANVIGSRNRDASLFALSIEQVLVEYSLDCIDIGKGKYEIPTEFACVTRDRKHPLVETWKQHRLLL